MKPQAEKWIRALFATAQGGICPICNQSLTGIRTSLDHSHLTGEVRGLLCQKDNLKVAIVETHTKKLPYTLIKPMRKRIEEYLVNHPKLKVVA